MHEIIVQYITLLAVLVGFVAIFIRVGRAIREIRSDCESIKTRIENLDTKQTNVITMLQKPKTNLVPGLDEPRLDMSDVVADMIVDHSRGGGF